MAHPGGRPPKFSSIEDLNTKIEAYFDTEEGMTMPTFSGLAVYLDTTRKTLADYMNEDTEFSYSLKKGKARIERFLEQKLYGNSVTGLIFTLKNNYGWVDKTEVDQNISGELKTGSLNPELADKFSEFLKESTKE